MILFEHATPILRIFDVAKAKEFYVDYLGFKFEWDHQFDEGMPLYMQISRGDLVIHLSEHYGDGVPGVVLWVNMKGVEEFHKELSAKNYKYLRSGVEDQRPDLPFKVLNIIDPFGNRIRFAERIQ